MTRLPWPADKPEGAEATPEQWMQMIKACDDDQLVYLIDRVQESSRKAFECLIMDHAAAMYAMTHTLPGVYFELDMRRRQVNNVQSVIQRWRTIDLSNSPGEPKMSEEMQAMGRETFQQLADWLAAALQVPADTAFVDGEGAVSAEPPVQTVAEDASDVSDRPQLGVETETS